jgi:photosynthetic reaction center cytochrome c subunit
MRLGSRRMVLGVAGTAVVWLLSVVAMRGQAGTEQRAPLAEEVFKNVQVLKGITVNEFMGTMGIFSAALGMSCEDCHAADDSKWENYATDNARKQMARRMITMMAAINKTNFGGRQMITCFTCHRGSDKPKVTPNLLNIYGTPPAEDPSDVIAQARISPPADQVLDKYIQALGGAQKLAAITSFTARGTSIGYGPDGEERQVEIYAKAPGQRTTVVHTSTGDATTTFDGRSAWIAAPHRPVAVLALGGAELEGVKFEAELSFPGGIKQALTKWRVGVPAVINDRDMQVVQGQSPGGALVTLYFDSESGLLTRMIRYSESPVGRIPTQIDYSDYRDVSGVKMPFKWTLTWLDGRDNVELRELRANVPVDAARFNRPSPPVAPKPR